MEDEMRNMVEHVARAAFERWDFAKGSFEKLPPDAQEHWRQVAKVSIEAMLPAILQIVHDQPFYPDTHTGMRQKWTKDQIAEKIAALTSDPTSA